MAEPRWVIFGAGGMLGIDIVHLLRSQKRQVLALSHASADITDIDSISPHIRPHDIVVNAAAYTRVDDAEVQRELAFSINAQGPANLAHVCAENEALLIQVSTDYVFGDAPFGIPVATKASYSPRCVYGDSKALGEHYVRERLGERAIIARVAWLYGSHGSNFVTTVLAALQQGKSLRIVDDQWGQPTWTVDAARALITLADRGATGTFHCTNSGHTSWFDFAVSIARLTGHNPYTITPIKSKELLQPASRPHWSVLECDAELRQPAWQDAIARFLGELS